jgi:hypothetical protein
MTIGMKYSGLTFSHEMNGRIGKESISRWWSFWKSSNSY